MSSETCGFIHKFICRYMDAEELINRYKKGERDFSGINLISDLTDVSLKGINLTLSNLVGVKFERVSFKNSKLFVNSEIIRVN